MWLDQEFLNHKTYFFKLAYNLLGERQEAEDIIQEVWLKFLKIEHLEIKNIKNYLARMVVNQALDRLKELKKQREFYKGTWLPEPWLEEVISDDKSNEVPSLDYALLFLLEKLNPYERAVFILREVFSFDYQEVSEFTGLSLDNCRQILSRTKQKLPAAKTKYPSDIQKQQEILTAFMKACSEQNSLELQKILKNDIKLYADGGGKVSAALKPLFGIGKVARHLLGVMKLRENEVLDIKILTHKENLFVILSNDLTEAIDSIFTLEISDNQIDSIFILRNPDKLKLFKKKY